MRQLCALVVLLLMAVNASSAGSRLEQVISSVDVARDTPIQFVEKRMTRLFAEPLELSGYVIFGSDGTLSKVVTYPYKESVSISDSALVVVRGDQVRRLKIKQSSDLWFFYSGLKDLLSGNADGLSKLYEAEFSESAMGWEFLLRPRSGKARKQLESITVAGVGNTPTGFTVSFGADNWQDLSFSTSSGPAPDG